MASGGRRSGQGPGKKNSIKNSEICNFWATQTLYTSKESWEQSSFRFEIKLEDFVMKKLKKKWFCDFRSEKILIFRWSQLNFWKTWQDSKKGLDYLLGGMLIDKVKNFCDQSMIPPLGFFRVNSCSVLSKQKGSQFYCTYVHFLCQLTASISMPTFSYWPRSDQWRLQEHRVCEDPRSHELGDEGTSRFSALMLYTTQCFSARL